MKAEMASASPTSMCASILDRCRPKRLSEFVGNKATIKALKETAATHPFNVLLVGPSGCGKSLLCDLVAAEIEDRFEVLHVKTRQGEDQRHVKQLVENFVGSKTIESFFSSKAKLVVLDDIDIMLATDKNFASFVVGLIATSGEDGSSAKGKGKAAKGKELKATNAPRLKTSIIMTCASSEERKIADLKKKTTVLRLSNPYYKDAFAFVHAAMESNDMAYEYEALKNLIEAYHCNIRNVMMNLHMLQSTDGAIADLRARKQFTEATHFDVVRKLFKMDYDIAQLRFVSDNTIVPLMMYENFPKELFKNRYKMADDAAIEMIETIMDRMLDAEHQESYMYHHMDWDMYDGTAILKMGYINHFLKGCRRKKTGTFDAFTFPSILTKLSAKCGFGRRVAVAKEELAVYELENVYRALDSYASLPGELNGTGDAIASVYCTYAAEIGGKNKNDVSKLRRKLKNVPCEEKSTTELLWTA